MSAARVASERGLDRYEAEALPADDVATVERLRHRGAPFTVGDGISDAPVLAAADVGIAMGSDKDIGTDMAGFTLMQSDPRLVAAAVSYLSPILGEVRS